MTILSPLVRPLVDPLGHSLRGDGLPWNDIGGDKLTPKMLGALVWIDPTRYAVGALDAFTDEMGNAFDGPDSFEAVIALNGTKWIRYPGGGYMRGPAILGGQNKAWVCVALRRQADALAVVMGTGDIVVNDPGTFELVFSDTTTGTWEALTHGDDAGLGAFGGRRSTPTLTLDTNYMLDFVLDATVTDGASGLTVDSAGITNTAAYNANVAASDFLSKNIIIGARYNAGAPLLHCQFDHGQLVVMAGSPSDSVKSAVRSYVWTRSGL